jgi:hypothetical protein
MKIEYQFVALIFKVRISVKFIKSNLIPLKLCQIEIKK